MPVFQLTCNRYSEETDMVAEQANEQASNEIRWVHRGWVGGYMGDTKMAAQDKDNLFVCLNQRNRLGYKTNAFWRCGWYKDGGPR